jgi:hypothetical protein
MAPTRSGQLDQISEAIGELKGSVKAIEQYVHEGRHGTNNLSQKIDALAVKFGSDIASLEARMDSRLKAVELNQNTMTTAKQMMVWIVQTVIAAIAAVAAVFALRGRP